MQTFQIEQKTEHTRKKGIEPQIGKGTRDRHRKIESRKYNAEQNIRDDHNGAARKRRPQQTYDVIQQTARRSAADAYKKDVKLIDAVHLNR